MNIVSSSVVVKRNRQIAVIGALSALVILMGIPGLHLGYLVLSPTVSLTIMHIPVVLAAILGGLPGGLITGAIFGCSSLINAAANPTGVLDPLFINPLCSVLPRMLFGVFAWILFKLLDFIPHMPKTVNAAITGFVATLFHTTVVIGSLYIFMNGKALEAMGGAGYIVVMGMILPGASMEALAATIVSAAVIAAIYISGNKKSKLSQEEED